MTETVQETNNQQGLTAGYIDSGSLYERLRDSAPEAARIAWRDGDRWAFGLSKSFRDLAEDESLSEEGRRQKAEYHLTSSVRRA